MPMAIAFLTMTLKNQTVALQKISVLMFIKLASKPDTLLRVAMMPIAQRAAYTFLFFSQHNTVCQLIVVIIDMYM